MVGSICRKAGIVRAMYVKKIYQTTGAALFGLPFRNKKENSKLSNHHHSNKGGTFMINFPRFV